MKIKKSSKYFSIAMYALFVIFISIIFFLFVYRFQGFKSNIDYIKGVLKPFIVAFFMAYILNIMMDWLECSVFTEKRFPKLNFKWRRIISIAITYLIFIIIIVAFFNYILPQIYNSVVNLVYFAPTYLTEATQSVTKFLKNLNIQPEIMSFITDKLNEAGTFLSGKMENIIPFFANIATSTLSIVGNAILGIFISFYMLLDKEKFSGNTKRVLFASLPKRLSANIIKVLRMLDNAVRAFIGAKAIDAAIVGFIFYIVLRLLSAKYAVLLAFILGITNMIPWFGCYLGAIPTTIVLAFQAPGKVWWFLIALIIIAQIDANVLSPKIQGEKMGLSPFWIMLALILGGASFGFMGFILGVPVFSVIYQLIAEWTSKKLDKKNLPVKVDYYYNLKDKDILNTSDEENLKLKDMIFEESDEDDEEDK